MCHHVCVSVGPSVCPRGTPPNYYKNFHETTRYLKILRKFTKKIQVLLNYAKKYRYFTPRRMYNYDGTSPNSSYNEKFFTHKKDKIKSKLTPHV
jgi:hypothetical protein